MSIKKFVVGLAVAALVCVGSVSVASAQTTSVDQLLQQIAALQAQLVGLQGGGSSMSSACTFTRTLTMGSRGADVTCLQNALIAAGHSLPAGATGYFGSQTKAAVVAWQRAAGVSPASGIFGPISRARFAAMSSNPSVPSSALCPNGMTLASNCMSAPSTVPPSSALCPNGMTLASNCMSAPSSVPVGQGTEGSITTRLGATPANNANVRTSTDVPVYGIEVSAINSDMSVDRLDLQFGVTPVGGSAQNPGTFINNLKIWDGSTLLKSVNVGTADFFKDTSDRYHVILTGIGFRVPRGQIRTVTVSASVASISSSDVNRTVTVQGYAGSSQNIRAVDTAGLQSYADMSGSANTRTHTFKPAGASTLTVSINSALTPRAGNNRVSSTNGITKKVLLAFDAKSESGNSKITKIYVASNATSTAGLPSTLYLCESSDSACANPISSASAATTVGGQSGFTSLSIPVAQDVTKTFLIAGDFPTTANGQAASSSLVASSVQWEKPDGSTASTTPGSAFAGNDQYMYGAVPMFSLNGTPTVSSAVTSGSTSATTTLTFKIPVRLTGVGGPVVKPVVGDFVLKIASTTATSSGYHAGNSLVAGTAGGTTVTLDQLSPTTDTVGDGSNYTFTLTGTIDSRGAAGTFTANPGNYRMVLTAASSSVNWFGINQTWALEDFQTPSAFLPN